MAIGLFVLLLEGAFVELLEAEGANKMLRVELPAHGGDAAAGDGFLAAGTERATLLVVMDFAEGAPTMLKEATVHEWGVAFLEQRANHGGLKKATCTGSPQLTNHSF